MLSVAKGTVCREVSNFYASIEPLFIMVQAKGLLPPTPDSEEEQGNLPTLTQLVLNLCEVSIITGEVQTSFYSS